MRRTKTRKPQASSRRTEPVDLIERLRSLKETELKNVQGGNQIDPADCPGCCC